MIVEDIWEGEIEGKPYLSIRSDGHSLGIFQGRILLEEISLDTLVGRLIYEMAKYRIVVECEDCGEIRPPLYCNSCASDRDW